MIIIIFTHCTFWPLFLWKKNDNRSNGAFSAKLKTSYKKKKKKTGVWIKPDTRFINEKMARYRHVLIGFKSFKRCTLTSLYIEVEFWSGESRGAAHWRCCIPKYVCWIQLYSQGRRVMTVGHVWIFLQQCLRDPGTFHSMLKLKDTAFEFPPSNEMRIDQAKGDFWFPYAWSNGPLVYLFQSCMLCVQIICLCMKSVLDYRLVTTKVETGCVGN